MTPDVDTEALEVRLLLEAIHDRYGYDFREYQSGSIRRRVLAALGRSGLRHLGDLQHELLSSPALFASVVDDLTVKATSMFRDPAFYIHFRSHVVPILRTYPLLKIWHAGCASGEEIYSLAILLHEEGLYERAQIYSTDVSATALDRARAGVYPGSCVDSFTQAYHAGGGTQRFDEYWSSGYERIAVRQSLRENIVFFQHDLATDYSLGEMHVILCRNVLMYFSGPLRTRVTSMFARALVRGGFLCLGASEYLPTAARGDFSEYSTRTRIYRRRTDR